MHPRKGLTPTMEDAPHCLRGGFLEARVSLWPPGVLDCSHGTFQHPSQTLPTWAWTQRVKPLGHSPS